MIPSGRPGPHRAAHAALALGLVVAALGAASCGGAPRTPDAASTPAAASSGASATPSSGPALGVPAPEVLLVTRDGRPFRLSEARGKVVVLNFWASWCAPCREEMPRFERTSAELADRVTFLGVNAATLDNREAALAFVDELGVSFPIVFDDSGEAAAAFGVSALPATFFIDEQGVLRARALGPVLADRLRENLALAGVTQP